MTTGCWICATLSHLHLGSFTNEKVCRV